MWVNNTYRLPALVSREGVSARRRTRWARLPALGSRCGSDRPPGWRSQTRRLGWDRVGLPSEPGGGFCQDFPFQLQLLVLFAQTDQFGLFFAGQAILALATIQFVLFDPVTDALRSRLKFLRQLFCTPPERASSRICWRYSGGYGAWVLGISWLLFPSLPPSTKAGQLHSR
jgi:hypothetical protein